MTLVPGEATTEGAREGTNLHAPDLSALEAALSAARAELAKLESAHETLLAALVRGERDAIPATSGAVVPISEAPSAQDQPLPPPSAEVLSLYAWQVDALSAWRAAGHVGVVQAVTGAGKTRVGLAAMRDARRDGLRCVVIVPTIELRRQWIDSVKELFPHERIGSDPERRSWDILVATVHAVHDRPVLRDGEDALLIADECHRYGAPVFARALKSGFVRRLGLSATFTRGDHADSQILLPYFKQVCFDLDYARARADDVIAPFRFAFAAVPFSADERREYDRWSDLARDTAYTLQTRWGAPREPVRSSSRPRSSWPRTVHTQHQGQHVDICSRSRVDVRYSRKRA